MYVQVSSLIYMLICIHMLVTARVYVEKTTLCCLKLLCLSLCKQEAFLDTLRQLGASTIVTRLERLLLGINPSTGHADYLITIAR